MYFCDESEVWKLTGPKSEQRQVCDTLRLTFFFMDLGEWLFVPSKVKQVMETNAHIEGSFHFLLTQSQRLALDFGFGPFGLGRRAREAFRQRNKHQLRALSFESLIFFY